MTGVHAPVTPRVAVVIVSYNTARLTTRAVASALGSVGVETSVVVVDNASTDGSVEAVRAAHPEAQVLRMDRNVGFGRANNAALELVDAPWILLLNSDAEFREPDGLRRLLERLEARPDVGVVGPRLEGPSGAVEYSARSFPRIVSELVRPTGLHRVLPPPVRSRWLGLEFRDPGAGGDADWLTGACLLVRRGVVEEVGGFDPAIFLFAEELEWCWRVRQAGWRIRLEPDVVVIHRRGASGSGPDRGKLLLAAAGEAYAVRRRRGWAYLAAFAAARVAGHLVEVVAQGVVGFAAAAPPRRARAGYAWRALVAWVGALLRGGAVRPAGPAILSALERRP